jgi:outer membrane immunogenic protein
MKRILAGCLAIGAMMTAQCAVAADLSVAPLYTKAPPAQFPQVYDWTGFYLGANGGGAWGHSFYSANTTGLGLGGGQAGGTVGYNKQLGNFVFGFEADGDWSGLNGNRTTAGCPTGCSTSDTWISTERGRIGYAFDRLLPYVTGGLAVGDIRASANGVGSGSAVNAGWTVGAGLEYALPGNWSVKAEYLYADLGRFNCAGCTLTPPDNVSLQQNIFRAGVNYHFGWGK